MTDRYMSAESQSIQEEYYAVRRRKNVEGLPRQERTIKASAGEPLTLKQAVIAQCYTATPGISMDALTVRHLIVLSMDTCPIERTKLLSNGNDLKSRKRLLSDWQNQGKNQPRKRRYRHAGITYDFCSFQMYEDALKA